MKDLPLLIKDPTKRYIIGVDSASDNRGVETFSCCITHNENGNFVVEQSFTIQNNVEFKRESPYKEYVEAISRFYDGVPVYTEKGKWEPENK